MLFQELVAFRNNYDTNAKKVSIDLDQKTKPTLNKIKDGKKIAMKKKNYH